jgi:hypothetical protein
MIPVASLAPMGVRSAQMKVAVFPALLFIPFLSVFALTNIAA